MASKKLKISDLDLQRVVFSEIYQRYSEPKAQRKAFEIMESAIRCLAKVGFDQITLAMIARDSGVTRPLLRYYFADVDDIVNSSLKYIRLLFQHKVVETIKLAPTPKDCLISYVDAHFLWVKDNRVLTVVWLAFLHHASVSKGFRKLNTQAVEAGTERLQAIIDQGTQQKLFKCANTEAAAKVIQSLVTGALVHVLSEEMGDLKGYQSQIKVAALTLAGDVPAF